MGTWGVLFSSNTWTPRGGRLSILHMGTHWVQFLYVAHGHLHFPGVSPRGVPPVSLELLSPVSGVPLPTFPTWFPASQLIPTHLNSSQLISTHLNLTSSQLISTHPNSSQLISTHLISTHLNSSQLISTHLNSTHLNSSQLISTQLPLGSLRLFLAPFGAPWPPLGRLGLPWASSLGLPLKIIKIWRSFTRKK